MDRCKIVKPKGQDEEEWRSTVMKLDKKVDGINRKIERIKRNDLKHLSVSLTEVKATLKTHKWLLGILVLIAAGGEVAHEVF